MLPLALNCPVQELCAASAYNRQFHLQFSVDTLLYLHSKNLCECGEDKFHILYTYIFPGLERLQVIFAFEEQLKNYKTKVVRLEIILIQLHLCLYTQPFLSVITSISAWLNHSVLDYMNVFL